MKYLIILLSILGFSAFAAEKKFCDHENFPCGKDVHCCKGLVCIKGICK